MIPAIDYTGFICVALALMVVAALVVMKLKAKKAQAITVEK